MSSQVPRVRSVDVTVDVPPPVRDDELGKQPGAAERNKIGTRTSTLWRSEGHPVDRKTGKYRSGGPFYVTHTGAFVKPWHADGVCYTFGAHDYFYYGPMWGNFVAGTATGEHYVGKPSTSLDESSLNALGTTAISQCAPTNPTAQLASTLAESFREGIPTLPGIQSWKKRTEVAKAAASEYLNYQFGWAPLVSEVHSVVNAARNHRDILQNYRHNEGRDVHRRFDFPSDVESWEEEVSPAYFTNGSDFFSGLVTGIKPRVPVRTVSVVKETRRWFEGCFTYGGPSGTDSFGRALGFGSEADAVFGLTLSPDVLWNLTPWSWAVDWFSNAGDVIHNVTNFALAGLVMRYGYMMEESIETYSTNYTSQALKVRLATNPNKYGQIDSGSTSIGFKTVRKSRCPANPFGFGISWEGLSPTQLAITAAIGITRLL